jgi:hypothetical protein
MWRLHVAYVEDDEGVRECGGHGMHESDSVWRRLLQAVGSGVVGRPHAHVAEEQQANGCVATGADGAGEGAAALSSGRGVESDGVVIELAGGEVGEQHGVVETRVPEADGLVRGWLSTHL